MIVPITDYDRARAGMEDGTIRVIAWQFLRPLGELFTLPIALLGDSARWVSDVAPEQLAAADLDWRFLAPPQPTIERPALVRLDILLPDRRRLAVLWDIVTSAAFTGLSFAALGDKLALTHHPKAKSGVVVANLGLGQLPGFEEIGLLVGAPMALGAL